MAERNDQVFQLSLTEIAFTISFILLLLLGYLVFKEQSDRIAAQEALAKVQSLERATAALDDAKLGLTSALQTAGSSSPDEAITRLIAADEVRAERDGLKQRVEELDTKLTALTELKKLLENSPSASKQDLTTEEVVSALALQDQVRKVLDAEPQLDVTESSNQTAQNSKTLPSEGASSPASAVVSASGAGVSASGTPPPQSDLTSSPRERAERSKQSLAKVKEALRTTVALKKQLREQLSKDLKSGREVETVREVVSAAKSYGELAKSGANLDSMRKENSDLRGQVAFLKNRLDARGGRDYPPCWADESGKVEFLFAIDLRADTVVVTPNWPSKRENDSKSLPGLADVLSQAHSYSSFPGRIQSIFEWSRKHDPECRHYVQLRSSIADAVQSDRARLMIENYFYKVEARR